MCCKWDMGSLYPALQRLLQSEMIAANDGVSENNRQARFYRLTAKGRKQCMRRPRSGRSYRAR